MLFLGFLWIVGIWWWIVVLAAVLSSVGLVLTPLAFPFVYSFTCVFKWLSLAFRNSPDPLFPVLPESWKGYPGHLVELWQSAAKCGFPTLGRWLFEGWHTH